MFTTTLAYSIFHMYANKCIKWLLVMKNDSLSKPY